MTDNGLGIAREQLEAIRKHMHEGSDDPDADIGLRNVYMLSLIHILAKTLDVVYKMLHKRDIRKLVGYSV